MTKPEFSYFKNGEFVQFTDQVLTILKEADPVTLKINPQVTTLKERFELLEKLYIIDQGNAITEEIKNYDDQRDNCLIGINLNVDSYKYHFQQEKRQASAKVRTLLNKYGRDLYRRSYPEETAGIRNMEKEVADKPELTTAIGILYLTDWFAELHVSNELFDEKYLERNKAYAEAPKEKFADVRKDTEKAYAEMAKHLNAHALITPSEANQQVISQIEQLAITYNQSVRNRIGNASGTQDDDVSE